MEDKMTRREALKGMFLAGMGLAVGSPLLHSLNKPDTAPLPDP